MNCEEVNTETVIPFVPEAVSVDEIDSIHEDTSGHKKHPEKNLQKAKKLVHCKDCEYTTTSTSNMYRHKMTVHRKWRHKCDICNKSYSQKHYLKQHKQVVHENMPLVCDKCPTTFISTSALRQHLTLEHDQNLQYQCEICSKKFVQKFKYLDHKNVHNGLKPHKCSVCGKCFAFRQSLTRHSHYCNDALTTYTCGICFKVLKNPMTLIAHMQGTHGTSKKICPCGKTFSWDSSFNRHKKSCQLLLANQQGNTKDQQTAFNDEFEHELNGRVCEFNKNCQQRKIIKPKKLFYCNNCEYSTVSSSNLYRHQLTIHEKRRYQCETCGKSYAEKYYLQDHITTVHENNQFICEKCSKCFTIRSSFQRHMKLDHESGPARFQCTKCNKRFFEKNNYLGHIASFHEKSKPHSCSLCNKKFAYKHSLQRHTKVCKGKQSGDVKDTTCKICLKELKSRESLKAHMRGKHKNIFQTCPCGKTFSWPSSFARHKGRCLRAQGTISELSNPLSLDQKQDDQSSDQSKIKEVTDNI